MISSRAPPRGRPAKKMRFFFTILFLAVVFLSINAQAQSSETTGVLGVDPVPMTVSTTTGQGERIQIQCSVRLSETSPNTSTDAVAVRELLNNVAFGTMYVRDDCSLGPLNDSPIAGNSSMLDLPPIRFPQGKPQNGSGTVTFYASWSFCYKSRRQGHDTILFQCEVGPLRSSIGEVTVVISDAGATGRSIYFGMAPFVFIFILIVACNMFLWKRLMARRLALQLALARQQHNATREGRESNVVILGITPFSSRPHATGLSPEAMNLIPKEVVIADDMDLLKEMCVICQSEYQVGDEIKRLNCKHVYHAACIDSWLGKASSCPICVTEVAIV